MPDFVVDCPFCDERVYVSPESVRVPFTTRVITDVWFPSAIHICRRTA